MISATTPLPPLNPNNSQQPSESFAAANIRSEMAKIQQSLQRSNQLYKDLFSDIPSDIPESLQSIQNYQNSISEKIKKNKSEQLKAKLKKYNSTIESLLVKLQLHIDKSSNNNRSNFFAEIFPSFEQSLLEQNQKILEDFEKTLLQKIEYYEKRTKTHSDESKYKFTSPFSDSSSIPNKELPKSTTHDFSTLDTILDLKKHNQRIQSLEGKVSLLLNRQKETQIALKNDTSHEVAESVIENHKKIKQLLAQSRSITRKIENQPPPIMDEPLIKSKNKSNIGQLEFDQFSSNINEMNDKILEQINAFEKFSEQKINDFNQIVDGIESKIVEFENSVNSLNELMANVNVKIERTEENYDELYQNKTSPQITRSNISNIIETFKTKISAIQEDAMNQIERLKSKLSYFESKSSL